MLEGRCGKSSSLFPCPWPILLSLLSLQSQNELHHRGEFRVSVTPERVQEVGETWSKKTLAPFFEISIWEAAGPMQTTQGLLELNLLIKWKG